MAEADNVEILRQRFASAWTDEGWLKGKKNFQPRTTDVFVVGYGKCGTAWMQQIVHQLRTGGDMEFDDVGKVVPVVEFAHDLHLDLEVDQKAFPRCFKTHYWYPRCPKGARYIWCVREPCASVYSRFNMLQGWVFQPGEVSLEDYIKRKWLPQGEPTRVTEYASYFLHLTSWWPHRNDPNVFLVFYEDLKEMLEDSVRSIAKFMGITDEGHIQAALERGTFEFMKQHSDKFSLITIQKQRNVHFGLTETAGLAKSKIRTGTTTEGLKILSTEIRCEIQKKWESVVTPMTGCTTYQELREAWKKEIQSKGS